MKESKGFARVGWILDYGLRFREEEGVGGWERKQLRIELGKDEEARVDLTKNAPDERDENQQPENQLREPKENLKGKRSNSKHLRQGCSPERRRG